MTVLGVLTECGVFGSWGLVLLLVQMLRHPRSILVLKDQPEDDPPEGRPSLAIVFAARDEALTVERAASSMLELDYPALAVVAVDDRSTDQTGHILDRLAESDSRLHVIHVHELPPGWLGKSHALQAGADATASDWILFTDADVVFRPSALKRAVGLAVRERLDHLPLGPDMVTETFGERVFMAMFAVAFTLFAPPWRVADRRKKTAIGLGAFNLVRAEPFRSIGGFRNIALSIDDDVRLGQALKFCGYRANLVNGTGLVSVRWQAGVGGMIRGVEKNFFAGVDFRLAVVLGASLTLPLLCVLPWLGVVTATGWKQAVCVLGIASACAVVERQRQSGARWYHALFLPLGAVAFLVALWRSTWLTLWRGGVRWRDRLYPLGLLKAHVRDRNAWLREVWLSTR